MMNDEQLKKVYLLVRELTSRGIPIPDDIKQIISGRKAVKEIRRTELGYFYKLNNTPYIPNDKVMPFLESNAIYKALIAGRGSGKALDIQTPILTANRYWVTMNDLQVGDYVFDEHGNPTEVLWVSDVMYDRKTYEVHFSDGSVIVADAEHLWTVESHQFSTYFVYRTMTTEELLQDGLFRLDEREKESPNFFINLNRFICNIVLSKSVPVKCISVNSDSNLYLAGTTLIPTHNSTAGSQCALKKLLVEEQDGAVINPSFENFKISTWPEFREWIPWELVIRSQQHRQSPGWIPNGPFDMVFDLGSNMVTAHCKGIKDPESARGPNINWLWYDEAREDRDGLAWQVATAGVRVGNSPQSWITTTPAGQDHWIYRFFVKQEGIDDTVMELLEQSGRKIVEIFYTTIFDNRDNLAPEFIASMLAMYPEGWLRRQEIYGEFVAGMGAIGAGAAENIRNNRILSWPTSWYKAARYWDLAGTEKKMVRGKQVNDPDETVGTFGIDDKNTVFVGDQVTGFWDWDKVQEMILETAKKDGPGVIQIFEQEPASGGKNQVAALRAYLKANLPEDYPLATSLLPREVGDRVMAANNWFSKTKEAGIVFVDDGQWSFDEFVQQVSNFPVGKHDDKVTSVSGLYHYFRPAKKLWKPTKFLKL